MLLCVALCFGVCSLLSGCHGTMRPPIEEFKIDAEFDEGSPVEITFWGKNENNPTQVAIYQKAIADFEALYPNIKVNFKPYSD